MASTESPAIHSLAVFSTQPYDRQYLSAQLTTQFGDASPFKIDFYTVSLTPLTAKLAASHTAVCVFVNDILTAPVLQHLASLGVKAILLRCAGFNNVDLLAAKSLGFFVAHVPSYSPEAVAEFAVALIQTLNRNTHRAYNRVREGNFALHGLLGQTLHGKTVGVVGTGRIGLCFARIMRGFGCRVLAYDVYKSKDFETEKLGTYVELAQLLQESDVVSLHCPLLESTRHLVREETLAQMKDRALLVNTSRGGLIDTKAVIQALKAGKLRGLALDVYEAEAPLFYSDHSGEVMQDEVFARLMTFPNVIVCSHQGFFTEEALGEISAVTVGNMVEFMEGRGRVARNSLIKD
ncbi:uncharacterized protein HMPREF1541_07001 [Cyphellophora europaea CBS 101466]|uniref:D-lactate dehydrogenase n=1 Tax=Cyphellophora europaea (strain CBS 101466) TaxID=1220924 RepID=W2RTC8_CYPE1|nr:uncharacterized protein HMPREF1541_07001 [Cyphellophora europaea CBS 101466]ETN38959.1 hypothetical protein HMPREF1541_07001 [Cyphellophora europaea CBS 101466]